MEATYKCNLLSNDEKLQFEAITEISTKLSDILEPAEQRAYSRTLIDMEIARILCHFVGVSNKEIMRPTLLALQIISDCGDFYTKNIARRAFTHTLQKGTELTESDEDEHQTLLIICNTLSTFVNRAVHRQIPVHTICNIESLLEFMNELSLNEVRHSLYILAVTNLYAAVMSVLDNIQDNEKLNIILEIHVNVLEAANKVANNLIIDGDMRFEDMMRPITVICNAGMRFYESSNRSTAVTKAASHLSDLNPHVNSLKPIFDITRKTLLENVIPNSFCIDVTSELECISSINFINCLCELYKCQNVDLNEFSWQITKHGYLKYLHVMLNESKPYHEGLCDVIAQITVDLSQKYLSMDKWSNGLQGFRKFMKMELMTLMHPISSNNTSPLKDALLFLIYIHFHATQVFNIVDYINAVTKLDMSKKIMDLSVDNVPEIPTLQVILFLFSASALGRPTKDIEELFHVALPRITEIVAKVGLGNCYMGIEKIPLLVLEGSVFPNQIPNEIVKLWLKYENDIYLLLTPGPNDALIDCLLNIVHSETNGFLERCSWKRLRTLDFCVNSALSLSEQTAQAMWANFADVLNDYAKERESSTELYLEMLNNIHILKLLKMPTIIECATAIIKVLLRDDVEISIKMQTLITQQAAKMFDVAYSARNDRVIWLFVSDYPILEKLCNQAFNKEHEDLAAVSFECLAAILRGQREFVIECFMPVTLSHTSLLAPLMPRESSYYDVLNFYDRMWIGGIDKPAVVIAPHTRSEIKETLMGIYRMYCVIHINSLECHWDCTFHCMANFLRYLQFDNKAALTGCCEYVCNSEITIAAIESSCYSLRFFDFVSVWIRYSVKRCTPSVVSAIESRKDRREMQERIFCESSFLKALYNMNKHIEEAIELEYVEEDKVKELIDYGFQLTWNFYFRYANSTKMVFLRGDTSLFQISMEFWAHNQGAWIFGTLPSMISTPFLIIQISYVETCSRRFIKKYGDIVFG